MVVPCIVLCFYAGPIGFTIYMLLKGIGFIKQEEQEQKGGNGQGNGNSKKKIIKRV